MIAADHRNNPPGAGFPDPYQALQSSLARAPSIRLAQRARRAQILASVRRLLAEHSFSGVTVRMVSETAALCPQTIYNLTGARKQMLSAAVCQQIYTMVEHARGDVAQPCFLISLANTFGQCALKTPDYIRESTKTYFPPDRPLHDAIWASASQSICIGLREMRDLGQLRPECSLGSVTESVMFTTNGVLLEWVNGAISDTDLAAVLTRAYLPLLQYAGTPSFVACMRDPFAGLSQKLLS